MIDLDSWEKNHSKVFSERMYKIVDMVDQNKKITPLDIFPELEKFKGKSWTYSIATGTIKRRDDPSVNYNCLLNCGLYDCIFIPIIQNIPSKNQFEQIYCLSREKDQKINFSDFLRLIEEGYILPSFISPTQSYNKDFYFDIIDSYSKVTSDYPPLYATGYDQVMLFLKKVSLACQDNIPVEDDWVEKVTQNHPQYEIKTIYEQIEGILKKYYGDNLFQRAARAYNRRNMSLNIQRLLIWNFREQSKIVIRLLEKSPRIGSALLYSFVRFFIASISYSHFGSANYNIEDLLGMLFISLSKDLNPQMRKELLSSLPFSSSTVSGQLTLENKILSAKKLFHFLGKDELKTEVRNKLSLIYSDIKKQDSKGVLKDIQSLNDAFAGSLNADSSKTDKLGEYSIFFGQTIIAGKDNIQKLLDSGIFSLEGERTEGIHWLTKLLLDKIPPDAEIRQNVSLNPRESYYQWLNKDWIFQNDSLPIMLWQKKTNKSTKLI